MLTQPHDRLVTSRIQDGKISGPAARTPDPGLGRRNDVIVIEENLGKKGALKTFDCDYNNYGTALREQPEGTRFDSITPRKSEGFLFGWTKAIVNYSEYKGQRKRMVSMDEWRQFSGLDQHTIFADPLYRDTAARDFRLDAKSPNRGAGTDQTTIGALAD